MKVNRKEKEREGERERLKVERWMRQNGSKGGGGKEKRWWTLELGAHEKCDRGRWARGKERGSEKRRATCRRRER